MHPEAVAELIRQGQLAAALDMLLEMWATYRDEELAVCIARLARCIKREPIAAPTRGRRLSEWLAIADDGDGGDTVRLLDCLDTFDRRHFQHCLDDMIDWQRDPRVGDALLALVASPRTAFSGPSHTRSGTACSTCCE